MDGWMSMMGSINMIFYALFLFLLVEPNHGFNPKNLNFSSASSGGWSPAGATWYGSPEGFGSDGGACEYGRAVGSAPFSSMIAAGGPSLFKSGMGCGACYQVKCTSNAACSGKPVTVVITDDCPGGPCESDAVHFDLSGTAFGAMAISGEADQLRNAGMLQVQYTRVPCSYQGVNIVFHVDAGSNPYYFAVVAEYVNGDGELGGVDLLPSSAGAKWLSMQHVEGGAVWKLNYWSSPLHPPFSLRVTTPAGKILTAADVIPADWQPGLDYKSVVNFKN